jgi:DNA (cytosine-5)-methyltransferase 1
MKKIKIFETFAGIGAQTKALNNIKEKLGVDVENVGISEWFIDGIIAYAKIHHSKEFEELKEKYKELTKKEIIEEYQKLPNYVFSSDSKKPTELKNIKDEKLKELYIANKVNKNFGSIMEVKGKELPENIDIFTYSFPCFVSGTLVMTEKGYKKIEDITLNDKVLTHNNVFKKVISVMEKESSEIYELKTTATESIFVTKEHPFLVKEVKRGAWNNGKTTTRPQMLLASEWKTIEEIKDNKKYKNYKIGIARNQKSELPIWEGVEDNRYRKKSILKDLIKLFDNKNFWWFVGLYIGDGWTQIREKDKYYRTLVCSSKTNGQHKRIEKKLSEIGLKYSKVEERTTYKYHICSKELTIFLTQFGKYASGKRLNETIFNLPKKYLKKFIQGYLFADGSKIKGKNDFKLESVSGELIYGFNQCLLKAYETYGRIGKIKRHQFCKIENRIVKQKDTYTIRFSIKQRKQNDVKYSDGTYWYPIRDISLTNKSEKVYNLEVEEDNSYTVYNLICHNCQAISLQGKQCGLAKDSETTSSLVWQVLRILEEMKEENKLPKVLLMENVKALFGSKFIDTWKEIKEILDGYGYNTYDTIINAIDKGSIQRRERVFAVSILKRMDQENNFSFNNLNIKKNNKVIKDILEKEIEEKYKLNKLKKHIENEVFKIKDSGITSLTLQNYTTFQSENILYSINGKSPTLTASGANSRIKIIDENGDLRYLKPIELWSLMGFEKSDLEKVIKDKDISNGLLYRMAGNSISVEVLEDIFEDILKERFNY